MEQSAIASPVPATLASSPNFARCASWLGAAAAAASPHSGWSAWHVDCFLEPTSLAARVPASRQAGRLVRELPPGRFFPGARRDKSPGDLSRRDRQVSPMLGNGQLCSQGSLPMKRRIASLFAAALLLLPGLSGAEAAAK